MKLLSAACCRDKRGLILLPIHLRQPSKMPYLSCCILPSWQGTRLLRSSLPPCIFYSTSDHCFLSLCKQHELSRNRFTFEEVKQSENSLPLPLLLMKCRTSLRIIKSVPCACCLIGLRMWDDASGLDLALGSRF